MHISRLLSAAAGAALLSACATVPDLGTRPEPRASQSFAATQSLASDATAVVWPGDHWWADYGDAQLSGLIEEALRGAPDLAAAAARLRSAQGYAEQAGAARLPSVGVEGSAYEAKQSYNNGIPAEFVPHGWNDTGHVAATLNFDLDLWGRNRAALRAATSDAEAARIELEQARLVLSTNIASAYADLARYARQRTVQVEALEIRTRTQRLVTDRVTSGLDTQAEQKQAEAGVPSARADLAATDEAIGLTRNRIAALLGQGPDRGLKIALPAAPTVAHGLPAGLTTDLIGRRPDIAASRARVEAAAARIKVARADFYPAVNLSALIGFQALGLNKLFDGGSTYGQVGPAVSLPIFRGGQLTGQYRGARAAFDEAVANYDSTVSTAYREVADAVTSQRALATRLSESRQALASSEQAYGVARQRYEGGLSTFLDVLTAEERVLQARQIVADLETRAFTLDVQLVRALGGGFSTTSAAAAASKDQTHG
ncbi:efflux transporter outer membrane subunit [Sphingomonas xinjiangensis]|uniref:NodT family efflux transporter outer membrane factor (OMF) lipoprotein n=1 Tax=Sphingomonas xinjiangensis TaxID=643568 RepID=A0A840YQ89_9SPHN|nr:efflux transporter outer membrane subunit [Sphingomonas xinjiangensis]MBB5710931.1 NodT family efflux transporter outer membrane factor (OMF) lipoprotein [Sphingomonas xinjiangensis]